MVHLPRPFRSSASNGTAKTSKESKESSKPINSSDTVDRNKEESAVSGSIDGGTMERLGVEREGTARSEGIMIPSIPPISRVSSRDKVPVGKRDRRRSTEVMMSSTEDVQEGMASAMSSSTIFTTRMSGLPSSPPISQSEHFHTPPESPEGLDTARPKGLSSNNFSQTSGGRASDDGLLIIDGMPSHRGPLTKRSSSLSGTSTSMGKNHLPPLPHADKHLPPIPPSTPPSRGSFFFSSSSSSSKTPRPSDKPSRSFSNPHHSHFPTTSSSSSAATFSTAVSFPSMPNGIIITPSSPQNDPNASSGNRKRRYPVMGRGVSDSAARLSLGEVLHKAEGSDRKASSTGPVEGQLVGKMEETLGDEAEDDDSDREMTLKRENTVRPKRKSRGRTSLEGRSSFQASPDGSPRASRRIPASLSVRSRKESNGDDEEVLGTVPAPTSSLSIKRDVSTGSQTRNHLSPLPIGAESSVNGRSPSPVPSGKSITFAEDMARFPHTSGSASGTHEKIRSASGPLPNSSKDGKAKSKGKKISDGSLSDSGMPSGRFASLGMGFAAGKKKLKKARSFSDLRKKPEVEPDTDKGEADSIGTPQVDQDEREEILSATPPRAGSPMLERLETIKPPAKPSSADSSADQVQKRKRSGSGGIFRSAAGFFGLRKEKKDQKEKPEVGTAVQQNQEVVEDSVAIEALADVAPNSPKSPSSIAALQVRRSTAPGLDSPSKSSRPVFIARPSTPSRAATLASSLTIRRRRRNDSSPQPLLSPPDGGKTPMGSSPRLTGGFSYFPSMSGRSSGASSMVVPDEFGSVSRSGWFDSPTNEGTPGRRVIRPSLSATNSELGPDLALPNGREADRERKRAQSDTPLLESPVQSGDKDISKLFDSGRPGVGSRSNSGNSAMFGKMKQAVSTGSTRRTRSGSLLREATTSAATSAVNSPANSNLIISPAASTVSLVSSFGGRISRQPSAEAIATRAEVAAERHTMPTRRNTALSSSFAEKGLASVSEQPPRPSESSSILSSAGSGRPGAYTPDLLDVQSISSSGRSGRKRSSTLFSDTPPRIHQAAPFGSPGRPRPPPTRRLSTSLFSSARSRDNFFPSPSTSLDPVSEPRRSKPPKLNLESAKRASFTPIPTVSPGDTGADWLKQVQHVVKKADMLGILATSSDHVHMEALQLFMQDFDFAVDALDVALRKLLLVASLPKETQQIDRVMEAFAKRYNDCHPGLLKDQDNAYVIAFSLMMLHTDVFNSNNKNKMTKADYVKNTRLDGVPQIVLETFFDNVAFTPFIFVDDEDHLNTASSITTDGMSSQQTRKSGSDLYDWIRSNALTSLKIDVEPLIPKETPYSYIGTRPFFDPWQPKEAFVTAPFIEVVKPKPRRRSGATLIQNATGPPQLGAVDREDPIVRLKVAKVGLLSRKDDLSEDGKKSSNRKWKSWSVVLTGSQLIFIKESTWALSLADHISQLAAVGALTPGYLLSPRFNNFKPDEVFSLGGAVAIYDRTYSKYEFAFRLCLPQGRQYLMQAADEFEMNEWINLINYASAFKTVEVAMIAPMVTPLSDGPSLPRRDSGALETQTQGQGQGQMEARSTLSPKTGDMFGSKPLTVESQDTLSPAPSLDGRRPSSSTLWTGTEPRDAASRLEYIGRRVSGYRIKLKSLEVSLDEELRIARNFGVLTPFQRSTRESIETALLPTAANVRYLRNELCRLSCWTEILDAESRIAGTAVHPLERRTPRLTLTSEEEDEPVSNRTSEDQMSKRGMNVGIGIEMLMIGSPVEESRRSLSDGS